MKYWSKSLASSLRSELGQEYHTNIFQYSLFMQLKCSRWPWPLSNDMMGLNKLSCHVILKSHHARLCWGPYMKGFHCSLWQILSATVTLTFELIWLLHATHCLVMMTIYSRYSRLSLSRTRRDPLKHFEISQLRHIRFGELRKIPMEQPNFTNEHVIWLL